MTTSTQTTPAGRASTLRDVAERSGVSIRTASRVLNSDNRVADATRARVQSAIDSLGYTPDLAARSLRAGTDSTIGLLVESIADPFFSELAKAVETVMVDGGYSVFVSSTLRDGDAERRLLSTLFQRRVGGAIITPSEHDHAWLNGGGTPLVFIDRPAPGIDADVVRIDDYEASASATRHLLQHGHRRIAYIGDFPSTLTSFARQQAYIDTLAGAGVAADPILINADCATPALAAAATAQLMALADPPTAIFSSATRCSLGIVPELHRLGRTDTAVLGFGDFAMADTLSPAISVVSHSAERIGTLAAERLLARIENPDLPHETVLVPTHLIARGSAEVRP